MALPQEPHERLLNRHNPRIENKEYHEELDAAFEGLINDATWIFSRVSETAEENLERDICLLLLRHMIEMADAVHILLAHASSRPARLQLRSMFEALLYLDFILEGDTTRRAKAYAVGSRLWSLRVGRRMLEGSQAREEFITQVASDPLVTQGMIDGWVVTVEEVQRAEEYLESDFFSEVYTKFKEFNRTPPWYRALDGRPTNLRELAIHLNRAGQFVLADFWSRSVHPDLIGVQLEDDEKMMRVLRDADQLGNTAQIAARILIWALELVLESFRDEELTSFRARVVNDITPLFAKLGPTDVTRVPPF